MLKNLYFAILFNYLCLMYLSLSILYFLLCYLGFRFYELAIRGLCCYGFYCYNLSVIINYLALYQLFITIFILIDVFSMSFNLSLSFSLTHFKCVFCNSLLRISNFYHINTRIQKITLFILESLNQTDSSLPISFKNIINTSLNNS